jgi:hypothetical protein
METTDTFDGSHAAAPSKPTAFGDNAPALSTAVEGIASSVRQLYRVGDAFLGKHAQDRPYVVLGTAAGIGFLLGGGLASKTAGVLMSMALRMAVTHAVDRG